jgi:hypothetical protein
MNHNKRQILQHQTHPKLPPINIIKQLKTKQINL